MLPVSKKDTPVGWQAIILKSPESLQEFRGPKKYRLLSNQLKGKSVQNNLIQGSTIIRLTDLNNYFTFTAYPIIFW